MKKTNKDTKKIALKSQQKFAEWKYTQDKIPYCSNCMINAVFSINRYWLLNNYCPNCGAKMLFYGC